MPRDRFFPLRGEALLTSLGSRLLCSNISVVYYRWLGKGKGSSLIVEQEKRYFYFFARFVTRFRSIVNVDDFQRGWVKLATIQSVLTLLDRCEYYLKIRISNK